MQKLLLVGTVILTSCVVACSNLSEKDLNDLQSPNDIVKMEAIQKLAKEEGLARKLMNRFLDRNLDRKAVSILVNSLRSGKESEDIQLTILKALGELGKRTEVPVSVLIEKLKDENPGIRLQAVESIGKIKDKKAVPALLQLLEDNANTYSIIWALGEIGDQRAIPALNSLLASEDKYLRYNASKAMEKIR